MSEKKTYQSIPSVNKTKLSKELQSILLPIKNTLDQLTGRVGNNRALAQRDLDRYIPAAVRDLSEFSERSVLIENWSEKSISKWYKYTGDGTVSFPANGEVGGACLKASGYVWFVHKDLIPYNADWTYRITFKVRRTAAASDPSKEIVFCGVTGVASDGVTLVNIAGADSYSSQHYIGARNEDLNGESLGDWVTFRGWFKGRGLTTRGNTPDEPSPLPDGIAYFRPTFVLNHDEGDGEMECDVFAIDIVPDYTTIIYEYSVDGLTDWHFPWQNGDIYFRYRHSLDTEWSDPIRFMGENGADGIDGLDGADGNDGRSTAQLTIYRRATSAPATPSGGNFNFGANILSPPVGWSASIPAGSDPVYASVGLASILGTTGTDSSIPWGNPELAYQDGASGADGVDGVDGADGLGSLPIPFSPGKVGGSGDFIFTLDSVAGGSVNAGEIRVQGSRFNHPDGTQRSVDADREVNTSYGEGTAGRFFLMWTDTAPTARFGGSDWGSSPQVVPIRPNNAGDGWDAFDNSGATYPVTIAATDCILAVLEAETTLSGLTAITPFVSGAAGLDGLNGADGNDGSDGGDGLSVYQAIIFRRATSVPATPADDSGSYNFTTNTLTPPSGWSVGVPSGSDPIYACEATFQTVGTTGTDSTQSWTSPALFVENGEDGVDGQSTYMYTVYRRSGSAPSTPSGGSFNFGTNSGSPPSGWANGVTAGTDPIYVSSALASVSGDTGTDSSLTWSAPQILARDGADGIDGQPGIDGGDGRSVAQLTIYRRSASAPAAPTGGNFNFTNRTLTAPTNWSNSVPAGTDPLYASIGLAETIGTEGTDSSIPWGQPEIIAQNGSDGVDGADGVQGPPGSDGQTLYTWIKYADNASGSGISDSPTGKEYMGLAINKTTPTESNTPSDYVWSLIQGADGADGVPGATGEDGQTLYTWVKYADNASGGGLSNSPTNKYYIGLAYNKTTATESTDPSDYTWSLYRGSDGADGSSGSDGNSVYQANIYRRSASAPATPANNSATYNFTTNTLTPPSGWSVGVPSGSDPVYVSTATFSIQGSTGTDSTQTWSAPVPFAENGDDGTDGVDGLSTYHFNVYRRASSAPATPTGGSFNFGTNTPTAPSGWSTSIPAGSDPIYVSNTLASVQGDTGTDSTLTWSSPVLMAQNGSSDMVVMPGRFDSLDIGSLPSSASITFTTDGRITITGGTELVWNTGAPNSGIGSSYQVRCESLISGSWNIQAAAVGTWITISSDRTWTITRTVMEGAGSDYVSGIFQIRAVGGSSVLAAGIGTAEAADA